MTTVENLRLKWISFVYYFSIIEIHEQWRSGILVPIFSIVPPCGFVRQKIKPFVIYSWHNHWPQLPYLFATASITSIFKLRALRFSHPTQEPSTQVSHNQVEGPPVSHSNSTAQLEGPQVSHKQHNTPSHPAQEPSTWEFSLTNKINVKFSASNSSLKYNIVLLVVGGVFLWWLQTKPPYGLKGSKFPTDTPM